MRACVIHSVRPILYGPPCISEEYFLTNALIVGAGGILHYYDMFVYLAPLKRDIRDRNVVMHRPIRPSTMSDGMNTEAAEAKLSIILGMKV